MSTVLDEGGLRFTFGDGWIAEKYDGHGDYLGGVQTLTGSKAVDFVALNQGLRLLLLIEVKDFRNHRIENKKRVGGDLATEVGHKCRDSVAGMVGALRTGTVPGFWRPYVRFLADRSKEVRVLLWLEEDRNYPGEVEKRNHKARQGILAQEVKKACRWLTRKAFVASRATYEAEIPELAVNGLPTRP